MRVILLFLLSSLSLGAVLPVMDKEPSNYGKEHTEKSARTKKYAQRFTASQKTALATNADSGLDSIIGWAVTNLSRNGFQDEANELKAEWPQHKGELSRLVAMKGQGDHKPLSQFIAKWYAILEMTLGRDLMNATRLSDLAVFNYCIPVVIFCEDNVGIGDYSDHFTKDYLIPREGLEPVVTYWASFAACEVLSAGSFFCGPIAAGAEWFSVNLIAPALNKPAWELICQ